MSRIREIGEKRRRAQSMALQVRSNCEVRMLYNKIDKQCNYHRLCSLQAKRARQGKGILDIKENQGSLQVLWDNEDNIPSGSLGLLTECARKLRIVA